MPTIPKKAQNSTTVRKVSAVNPYMDVRVKRPTWYHNKSSRLNGPPNGTKRVLSVAFGKAKKVIRVYLLSPLILLMTIPFMALIPQRYLQGGVRNAFLADISRFLKRLLDIAGAITGFIISSIFLLIIPILIKLETGGNAFYKQERIGRDRRKNTRRQSYLDIQHDQRTGDRRKNDLLGRPFGIYKFRSMVINAEDNSGPVWAKPNDPRITRVGRFIRFTHIDEIPQFINVLKGDMSLVGPRPERPEFVKSLSIKLPNYKMRLKSKPGITGMAQVNTGYDASLDDVRKKLNYDIYYVQNRSLIGDIAIILKTLWVVIRGQSARQ